ncbi:MAG: type III pantothenate kinase [Chloroflexi bacterium]|nr:type III pantothenate kinase [Chloroflexota bacterium]
MIAIDVGNSTVKVARIRGTSEPELLAHLMTRMTDGTAAEVAMVTDLRLKSAIEATGDEGPVALVSVVPAWTERIRAVCAARGLELLEAGPATIPMHVRLAHPDRVGADRLLGAWTARELVGAPVVVVDVGTATTLDVVDGSGDFVGGAILPGPALALRSLGGGTALLPEVSLEAPERTIGRDTVEAIQAGVVGGHAAAIEGLLARITDELGGTRPQVVLTGGDAEALGPADWADRVDPLLLLRGLGMLAASPATRATTGAQS